MCFIWTFIRTFVQTFKVPALDFIVSPLLSARKVSWLCKVNQASLTPACPPNMHSLSTETSVPGHLRSRSFSSKLYLLRIFSGLHSVLLNGPHYWQKYIFQYQSIYNSFLRSWWTGKKVTGKMQKVGWSKSYGYRKKNNHLYSISGRLFTTILSRRSRNSINSYQFHATIIYFQQHCYFNPSSITGNSSFRSYCTPYCLSLRRIRFPRYTFSKLRQAERCQW